MRGKTHRLAQLIKTNLRNGDVFSFLTSCSSIVVINLSQQEQVSELVGWLDLIRIWFATIKDVLHLGKMLSSDFCFSTSEVYHIVKSVYFDLIMIKCLKIHVDLWAFGISWKWKQFIIIWDYLWYIKCKLDKY